MNKAYYKAITSNNMRDELTSWCSVTYFRHMEACRRATWCLINAFSKTVWNTVNNH